MIILLNKNWRINSDSRNWILQRRKIVTADKAIKPKNIGTEYWVNEPFAGSLDVIFEACAQKMLRFSDATVGPDDIEPILKALDDLKRAATELSRTEKAA